MLVERSGLRAYEVCALALIVALGAYLRLAGLDFAQFRADDVALWTIVRQLLEHPQILTRGMHSSFGLPNGPFQAYILLPGALATRQVLGAYFTVAGLNALGVLVFWAFVRKYWGPGIALVAVLLYAVNPWAVIFSRRLWGNDLVPPFATLLIWSLCDLIKEGRRRDSVLPFVWLAIVIQVYVVALLYMLIAALGIVLGARRLRLPQLAIGLILFAILTTPYFVGTVLYDWPYLNSLLGTSDRPSQIDLESIFFMFHVVSSEGYQAFVNNAGALFDASSGLPKVVSLLTEALLGLGLASTIVRADVHWRAGRRERAASYILVLGTVVAPAVLLVRHTAPVYPYYLLVGFPMHFLLAALGVGQVWAFLVKLSAKWGDRIGLVPIGTLGPILLVIVGTHLFLAQVFFVAVREYWPKSDYGLPLHYTLDIVESIRNLRREHSVSRVYIGGSDERDRVLYQRLRLELPGLSLFNSEDTLVTARAGTGKALYVLSSVEDVVGRAFAGHLRETEVASLAIPGHGVQYRFYVVDVDQLFGLFADSSAKHLAVTFDGQVRLERYAMERELRPGRPHRLVLEWTLLDQELPASPSYHLYLRLVDHTLAVYEKINLPFWDPDEWRPGERAIWWRAVNVPETLEPGAYWWLLGLYTVTSRTSYQNAAAYDSSGAVIGDGVRLGPLSVISGAVRDPAHRLLVPFGEDISLIGYDLDESNSVPGGILNVDLYWKVLDTPDRDYTVFVHLLGPDGRIVTQHDGQPAGGNHPTTAWLPGDTILDRHTLKIPSSLTAGTYTVSVGLYYLPTNERLGGPAFAASFPATVRPGLSGESAASGSGLRCLLPYVILFSGRKG